MIIVVNAEVKPDRVQDFIDATKKSQTASLNEQGCFEYTILRNNVEPNKFTLIEEYADDDAFNLHKETAHFQEWRNITFDMMLNPRTSSKNTLL